MDSPSIFSKIISGDIPCHKVYETDTVLAFLDIYPIQPGHTLVVPKVQIDHFDELPDDVYQEVFSVVKRIANAQKQALGSNRVCLRVEGFDVPHAHVHVYPCNTAEDFYNKDRMATEPDHAALSEIALKLSQEAAQ